MAGLIFAVLILAMAGYSSGATWCVCKDGVGETALQKTLDYACGSGADCNIIHPNGACFNPNTRKDHCDYAVNSYFQRKGQATGSCDFAGTAAITTTDPSSTGCVYPATASAITNSSTTTPMTPGMNTPSTNNPYMNTPNGFLNGQGNGFGPSIPGINNDYSHGAFSIRDPALFSSSLLVSLVLSGVVFLWN